MMKIMTTKKRLIIGIVVLSVLIVLTGSYYITIINASTGFQDTFEFEYGEVIDLQARDVLYTSDQEILDSFVVDYSILDIEPEKAYSKIGRYTLPFEYQEGNKVIKKEIEVIIQDTVGPQFENFLDRIEVEVGNHNIVLEEYFEATDLNMDYIYVDSKHVNYDRIGQYTIEVNAFDKYGNKTVKNSIVSIVANTSTKKMYYAQGVLLVNKKHPLPQGYAPGENKTASNAVSELISEMQAIGYDVNPFYNGYCSYAQQTRLYYRYVSERGQEEADMHSVRPGYSEHQTGLAFDLLNSNGMIMDGEEEQIWLANNAHRFGFIVRYPKGYEAITGYTGEPAHIRYLGEDLATKVYLSNRCLEDYLGIDGGNYME